MFRNPSSRIALCRPATQRPGPVARRGLGSRLIPSLTLAAALAAAIPAHAVPATDAGASRITEALRRYVGPVPGVVETVAEGETYRLTLDATPLLDHFLPLLSEMIAAGDPPGDPSDDAPDATPDAMSGVVFSVPPVTFTLTDRGDGTWGVRQDQQLRVRASLPGLLSFERAGDLRMEGIFDPRLGSFTQLDQTETNITSTETQFADGQPFSEAETTVAETAIKATGAANPAGGVDMQTTLTSGPLVVRQKIFYSLPDPETGRRDTFGLEASMGRYSGISEARGVRATEMLDLLAWAVALPSLDEIPARQDELKRLLRAALPLFQDLRLSMPIEDLRVATAIARGGFKRIDTAIDTTGLVSDGRMRLAMAMEGPDLPVMMLDPWMRPLVPQAAGFDVTMTGFDAKAAGDMMLAALDLTAEEPFATLDSEALGRAILPSGRLRFDLAPSLIEAPDYTVAYGGWLETGPAVGSAVGPAASPDAPAATGVVGELRIEAAGLDGVERQIEAGFGNRAVQTLGALRHLRTLAEKKDGRDLWVIDLANLSDFMDRAEPPLDDDMPGNP